MNFLGASIGIHSLHLSILSFNLKIIWVTKAFQNNIDQCRVQLQVPIVLFFIFYFPVALHTHRVPWSCSYCNNCSLIDLLLCLLWNHDTSLRPRLGDNSLHKNAVKQRLESSENSSLMIQLKKVVYSLKISKLIWYIQHAITKRAPHHVTFRFMIWVTLTK